VIRASLLFALAFLMLASVGESVLAQRMTAALSDPAQEHRVTVLETKMDILLADMAALKHDHEQGWEHKYAWLQGLLLSGLAGHAGMQAVKGRKRSE
jgi:hypothetical protein